MAVDTNTSFFSIHRGDYEIENLQLQVGAFLMSQYPIRSHAGCYSPPTKSLGIAVNSLHDIDVDGNEYRNAELYSRH